MDTDDIAIHRQELPQIAQIGADSIATITQPGTDSAVSTSAAGFDILGW